MADSVQTCDVCIVGAGLAGMNALFVASEYLTRDQRVVLVDRRPRVGGMWVDTYDYVRLHQPHPMFTAGNIGWTLGKHRSYLASKGEVLGHFDHCLDVIRKRVTVDEYWGWSMESDEEIPGKGVRVTCRSADGQRIVVEAKRLIKAYGFRIDPNDPLPLSSSRVTSVSPDSCDMRSGAIALDDAPVWIVGGGKTAMDTALALITENPGREVNLIAGSGTFFNDRDKTFPPGAKRWWAGRLASDLGAEVARRFDGANEDEVWDWHRATYGTWLTPQTGNFLLGNLSDAERAAIAAGLGEVVMDHLVDVVDREGGGELVLRSGATTAVAPGSWIVNCTGYVNGGDHGYEPYISPGGNVLSIQMHSATLHLSSYMGYFMPHLMFQDKLRDLPLYELEGLRLRTTAPKAFPYVLLTLAQYNISLMSDALPLRVFSDCGLNFDRWYPLPRRVIGNVKFAMGHRRDRAHQRRSLDVARERFGIRCGPLDGGVPQSLERSSQT